MRTTWWLADEAPNACPQPRAWGVGRTHLETEDHFGNRRQRTTSHLINEDPEFPKPAEIWRTRERSKEQLATQRITNKMQERINKVMERWKPSPAQGKKCRCEKMNSFTSISSLRNKPTLSPLQDKLSNWAATRVSTPWIRWKLRGD